MQLFELFATLSLNSKGFDSALKGATGSIGNLTKNLALTQVAIQGVEKGFQTMTQFVSKSVDGFADYEQMIGGVETLFKDSSKQVKEYAEQAYKTAGMNQNQYMDMVTSFSASLLQGLGGNTEEAAKIADQAIIDMSDNVNKMGTSMEAVQNAYKGFARGNFTMLDNLRLGYSGTQQEMIRLINDSGVLNEKIDNLDGVSFDTMIKAIHKVQDEMGITGTTAKEAATTISGSKSSMQAAFDNLLTSISIGDQETFNKKMNEFQGTFLTYVQDNFLPTLENAIGGSGALVHGLLDAITHIDPNEIANIVEEATFSGTEVFKGLTGFADWLVEGLTDVFTDKNITVKNSQNLGAAVGEFIGSAITDVITNAPKLVEGLFSAGVNLAGGLIDGLFSGLFGTGKSEAEQAADIITNEYVQAVTDAEQQSSKLNAIAERFTELAKEFGTGASNTSAWASAIESLKDVAPDLAQSLEDNKTPVTNYADEIHKAATATRELAIEQAKTKALQDSRDLVASTTNAYYESLGRKDLAEKNLASYEAQLTGIFLDIVNTKFPSEDWGQYEEGYTAEDEAAIRAAMWADAYMKEGTQGLRDMVDFAGMSDETYGRIMGILQNIADDTKTKQESEENLPDLKEQMDFAQGQLESREAAIQAGIEASSSTAEKNIEIGGSRIQSAIQSVADAISSVSIPSFIGGVDGDTDFGQRAVGLRYVPYDGTAYLHKGEQVLTAAQAADNRRKETSKKYDTDRLEQLIDKMENINVYLSAEKVGQLTSDTTGKIINQRKNHTLRGMGG